MTAGVLAILGFVPLANLVRGGWEAPWYAERLGTWITGSTIVFGVAIVLVIVSSRTPFLWRTDLIAGREHVLRERHAWIAASIALLAFATYAVLAKTVFGAQPLLIDEVVQLLHARSLVQGRLWTPADVNPEFFSVLNMVDASGRVYSQYPVGGPLMLAIGELLGAAWLTNAIFGGLSVLVFASLTQRMDDRGSVAVSATALFAFAPLMLFASASHMNHVPTLFWVLLGCAGLAQAVQDNRTRLLAGLCCGLAFGIAATIRPVDALAFALPAGGWLMYRAVRDRTQLATLLAAGAGLALPLGALALANAATTGSPFLLAYKVLWGETHGIGFHQAPWGVTHTPARGLELISLYFLRLQTYLYEAPIPALLPVIGALALSRRLGALDRYLLVSGALLVTLYFAYWHDGFYLGPRFLIPLLPALALWTARLPASVRERFGGGSPAHRGIVFAGITALVIAAVMLIPSRAAQYRAGLITMRWDVDRIAADAGVRDALVFVRESWGSQVIARLWSLEVGRPFTEQLYAQVDLCALDSAAADLERRNVRGEQAVQQLRPLLGDSARVVRAAFGPDASPRALPGTRWSARCMQRVREDNQGFMLLGPALLARRHGNVYARDLHQRDSLLLARHPDRRVFLLTPVAPEADAPPRFHALDRDSLWRVWRSAEPHAR